MRGGICFLALVMPTLAAAYPDDPYRSPMWDYNLDRYLGDGAEVVLDERIDLKVPPFAEDSAQVPLTVDLSAFDRPVQTVITWVDLNPIPHLFTVEPNTRVSVVSLNFRVQQATTVRAAVQDAAGVWHVSSAHVDAAGGGCTAPSVASANPDWEATFGQIRGGAFSPVDRSRLKVSVRHPMDSGMVGNIPAFHIERLELRAGRGEANLLTMTLSESAAENPVFVFELPDAPPVYDVWMRDNNGNQFERIVDNGGAR
ncbi:quinoprotein dehydrogenase-associated SoxYZ-like carrier [Marinobacter sp. JSM 1782161]|uniref:quinoprotein dehydrogenase-associated SoxYZ-like carrier n=1 Tax=Marinobacter sp. JSM 1782161 TaxID=2685906 RepID=UPI0014027C7C|nr:quinoprotein dehydrogenase-associated SoxYZ-like carrier [Marinobacter sp. JSM 1782161]